MLLLGSEIELSVKRECHGRCNPPVVSLRPPGKKVHRSKQIRKGRVNKVIEECGNQENELYEEMDGEVHHGVKDDCQKCLADCELSVDREMWRVLRPTSECG